MLTNERIEKMRTLANMVLGDHRTNTEQVLAGHILVLTAELRGPRELSEEQGQHVLEVEKKLFTTDHCGAREKRLSLNALMIDLFGWSPWQGAEEPVNIPANP